MKRRVRKRYEKKGNMHSGDGIVHGNDKYGLCKRNRDNYRR